MPDWLAERAARSPRAPAVLAEDADLDWGSLDARATDLAERLAGAGAGPAARVAVRLPASAAQAALVFAAARLGAVLLPLDPRLPPPELREVLRRRQAALLVTWEPAPEGAVPPGVRARTLAELREGPAAPVPPRADWAGVQGVVATSGTSGQPRGVLLTFENHLASAAQVAAHLALREDDRWLACVPPFHVGGLAVLFRACLHGAAAVLQPRFDPHATNAALDARGVTLASMVPVMLRRTLDARGARPFPPALRAVVLGGDAAPDELLAAARARGLAALPSYGLTEASSMVACAPLGGAAPAGSSGRSLGLARLSVQDDAGRELPAGEVGEVVVQGPAVMLGYDHDPKGTAHALRGGALHTGDVGRLDAAGWLWVLGRLDDRITTGGEKVDPLEVEQALGAHPGVADACVVGLPDAAWGQRVAAAVVPRGPAPPAAELEAHCRSRLAPAKVPRVWRFVQAIPRTPAGKPRRSEVRAALLAGSGAV